MTPTVCLVGEPEADRLLAEDPFALLTGMLLDQQIGMEVAFAGPKKLADRMDGFSITKIAETEPEEFVELCVAKPAIHRYGGSMGRRVHALAQHIVEHYDGQTEAIWTRDEPSGKEILRRLKALPGFGDQKARIFLALLGKQFDLRAEGWREAAGGYGEAGVYYSIADVVDAESLNEVRSYKKAAKAAAKTAKQAKR